MEQLTIEAPTVSLELGGTDREGARKSPAELTPWAESATGRIGLAAKLLIAASFLGAAAAGLLIVELNGRIEALQREVQALKNAPAAQLPMAPDSQQSLKAIRLVDSRVDELMGRLDELALMIEGPMSHLQEGYRGVIDEFDARIAALEQSSEGKSSGPISPLGKGPVPRESWVINLASLSNQARAKEELARMQAAGLAARVQETERNGRSWYRLQVTGFESYDAAKAELERVKVKSGLDGIWVGRE